MPSTDGLTTLLGTLVVGSIGGFLYGLLFSQSYARVFFMKLTPTKSIIFSCIRHGLLGFTIMYLLHSTLLGSILVGISFLLAFWIAVLYIVREENNE
jgi:hypothetical protein